MTFVGLAFGTGGEQIPLKDKVVGSIQILMFTVYVLIGSGEKIYKGMTNDLRRRLREHASGKTITTRKMDSVRLIYKEEYDSFIEARNRELYFKTAAGRKFLKKKINIRPNENTI